MGYHICPTPEKGFAHGGAAPLYNFRSGGHSFVEFSSGNKYCFPDALAYYAVDCNCQPDAAFVRDVMESRVETQDNIRFADSITRYYHVLTMGVGPAIAGPYCRNGEKPVGFFTQGDVDAAFQKPWDNNVNREAFLAKLLEIFPVLKAQRVEASVWTPPAGRPAP